MKRFVGFVAVAIGAIGTSIALSVGVASAWHPLVSGQPSCMETGGWTVHWTVGNSETAAGAIMTFDSAEVNGLAISLSPSSVAPGASATGTSTLGASTGSATFVVVARWASITPNEVVSGQVTVAKPECDASTTTSTTAASSTTVGASTTTAAETTTTSSTAASTTTTSTTAPSTTTSTMLSPGADDNTAIEAATVTRATLVTAQVAPRVEAASVSLPATGAVSLPLLASGVGLVLIGTTLVLTARRRSAEV